MSKQTIAACEQQGVSTPQRLAKASSAVNAVDQSLIAKIDDELIVWLESSIETLGQLEALLRGIKTTASVPHDENPRPVLDTIRGMADIGAYVASDIANCADCARERFQEFVATFRAARGGTHE